MKIFHSIQFKLLVIIILASLGVIVVGILSVFSLKQMTGKFDDYINTSTPKIRIIQQALIAMEGANSSLGFALSVDNINNIEDINQYESEFNHAVLQYDVFISALLLGSESEEFRIHDGGIIYSEWKRLGFNKNLIVQAAQESEKKIIEELEANLKQYITDGQKILSFKRKILRQDIIVKQGVSDETKKELIILVSSIKAAREKNSKLMEAYISEKDTLVKSDIEMQKKFAMSMYNLIFVIMGVNLLGVIFFGTYLTRLLITKPIQRLTNVVNDISIGKFDTKIDLKTLESPDEIGELARAFDRTIVSLKLAMKDQKEEDKGKQNEGVKT